MQEINEHQVLELESSHHPGCVVFLYTPMCGTCMAAKKMLEVLQAMDQKLPLYSCNMNLAPQLAIRWKVESVPCIVVLRDGTMVDKIYAVQSVSFLYERFVKHGVMMSQ